jgi:hypothetical protein
MRDLNPRPPVCKMCDPAFLPLPPDSSSRLRRHGTGGVNDLRRPGPTATFRDAVIRTVTHWVVPCRWHVTVDNEATPARAVLLERVAVEHGLARLGQLGIGQAHYAGRKKTRFQMLLGRP